MRVAAVELPDGLVPASHEFSILRHHVDRLDVDLLVLNELPFGYWPASAKTFDSGTASTLIAECNSGLAALAALPVQAIVTTRAWMVNDRLVNEAIFITSSGISIFRQKQHLPQEEGYFERSWFKSTNSESRLYTLGPLRIGSLICTELMFNELARGYGKNGANVIAVPRATDNLEQWLIAARMAALVSGCYVVSSNRNGSTKSGQLFGGAGFIISPDGTVLGTTTRDSPVFAATVDFDLIVTAQASYPCYLFS